MRPDLRTPPAPNVLKAEGASPLAAGETGRRKPRAQRLKMGVLLTLGSAVLGACGSRGDPLPPVYPNPPAIPGLTVAQRGAFGVLRFPEPARTAQVGAEDIELDSVEILVYAERHPVLTLDMLIAGLRRHREVMVQDARAEAAAARARALLAENIAAGIPPPEPGDPEAPATTVRRRTPDEDAIHRLPEEVHLEWQRLGLAPDAILAAAGRLANVVGNLWSALNLPATIIDTASLPVLPEAGVIAAAAEPILRRMVYERQLEPGAFLGRAAVSRRIPYEQFEELRVDNMLQVTIPLGTPSPSDLRTRYFFAVRGRSTNDTPGEVSQVVGLAPAPVPIAPQALTLDIGATGVTLSWEPPPGDLLLRRLDPLMLRYNVYRMPPDGTADPTPLNGAVPLAEPSFLDITMQWGETYVYEVRALMAGPAAPLRESDGARTDPVEIVDIYPPAPPTNLVPSRAGNRVALQWTGSTSLDIVGYRVYRHVDPAPPVPQRYDPTIVSVVPDAAPQSAPVATDPAGREALIDAGWELITADPVPFSNYTDPQADPARTYVYAVEAIDAAGNLSPLAVASEAGARSP